LAVVQTNLEIVRSNPAESVAEQKKWLDNISESVAVMGYLVDSLLFLARMDSQQYSMEKKTFALDQAIANVIEPFHPLAESAGLDLTSSLEDGLVMCGDEFRIKQVVGILVDNALRHTVAGSIDVSLQKQEENILFSVTDSGEGIESQHLEKIFERFYQVESSRSRKGAGLGLSIARCIIETHGGSIRVVSKRGTGSTFLVTLPLSV
jgi:signal transduction histidine kinase